MDISKHSTASYKPDQSDEVNENIRKYWEQVAEAKIKKFKEELK